MVNLLFTEDWGTRHHGYLSPRILEVSTRILEGSSRCAWSCWAPTERGSIFLHPYYLQIFLCYLAFLFLGIYLIFDDTGVGVAPSGGPA